MLNMIRVIHKFSLPLSALLLLLCLPALTGAQTPDLSGRWILQKDNSIIPQGAGGGGGRGSRGGGGGMASSGLTIEMVITHEDNSLTIARVIESGRGARDRTTETFTTDGEPNVIETDAGEFTITAKWMRNSLIVDRTRTMEMRGREMKMTTTETYTQNEDATWMMVFIQPPSMGGSQPTPLTLNYEKKK